MTNDVSASISEITVSAVITRANGAVEDQGVIAHWKKKEDFEEPRKGFLALINKALGIR